MHSSSEEITSEIEILIDLSNKLFDLFESNKIFDLKHLSNEFILKKLLKEIEPEIEAHGKLDFLQDNNFGIKYSNMVLIINVIESYLETEKNKLKIPIQIKKLIRINDLLKS